jgi:hypothetical protein
VRGIFGADPEGSPALRRWVGELVREERRPFDCVGTQGESRLALFLACRNGAGALARREGWEVPDAAEAAALAAAHLAGPQGPHHLPPELAPAVLEFLSGPGGDELRPYPARLQGATNLD